MTCQMLSIKPDCFPVSDVTTISNDQGNILRLCAKLLGKKMSIAVYCKCMYQNTCDVSVDSEAMLSFFGCSKFSVRDYNTSDVPKGQTFAIN